VVAWVVHPGGALRTGLRVVGVGALLVWAGDEIVRGVNPWRRLLGTVVGVAVVLSLVAR
jgi:hypothetical protein